MSGRLASFRGPSTPSSSPVAAGKSLRSPSASSPSHSSVQSSTNESTYHRKTRALLLEVRNAARTWEEIVTINGAKSVRDLTDARTELDNALALLPSGTQPRARIVGPKAAIMDKCIDELDTVVSKLEKQLLKMANAIENLETLLFEAAKAKSWNWVQTEPLWCTWPLEKFASTLPTILHPYNRAVQHHKDLLSELRNDSISFERSRVIVSEWTSQPWLAGSRWDEEWEDLMSVEVERWDLPLKAPVFQ